MSGEFKARIGVTTPYLIASTNSATPPTTSGTLFYNSTLDALSYYDASGGTNLINRAVTIKAYNNTGSTIASASVVYVNGVSTIFPTIALAQSNSISTSVIVGITNTSISTGSTGYVTVSGLVTGVNTSSYTPGTDLYLSATTPGALVGTSPVSPNYSIQVGVVISQATSGSMLIVPAYLSVNSANIVGSITNAQLANSTIVIGNSSAISLGASSSTVNLENLSNVAVNSAQSGQFLSWNGASWVNTTNTQSVSAGPGLSYWIATPIITATSTNNFITVLTYATSPVTTGGTQTASATINNRTTELDAAVSAPLGRTLIDAGQWTFDIYAGVSATNGGRISSLTSNLFQISYSTASSITVSTTGTGTSRTATASTSFFSTAVASATNTSADYLQTPQGLYQITAKTSNTVVTILVPGTYTNETSVNAELWHQLFSVSTPTITSISPAYGLYSVQTTQPSFTINSTDSIGKITYGVTNNNTTVTLAYNGSLYSSNVLTPLSPLHNQLSGLQGGQSSQYYHLTSTEYTGTGTGTIVRTSAPSLSSPTISNYGTFASQSSNPSYAKGLTWYNGTRDCLSYYNSVTNNEVHIGQEIQLYVYNNSGNNITIGQPVYITGQSGGVTTIALARANSLSTANVIGLAAGTINTSSYGYIIVLGSISGYNTSGFSAGDTLYLDYASAGNIVNVQPTSPNYSVRVGFCVTSSSSGEIFASVRNNYTSASNVTSGILSPAYGGTGVSNNSASTITISGNYGTTLTVSGTTSLTLPTSGTVTALGNSTTGSGNIVLASSPTLSSPTITGELTVSTLVASQGMIINSQTISQNYTIAVGYSASSAGPITVSSGKVVTVSSGSRWVIS